MAKIRAGDPLSVLNARDWNRFVDVAEWYERTQRLGKGGPSEVNVWPATTLYVRNNTAGNRAAGDVVEISGTDITTLRRDQCWLNGIVRAGVDPACGVYLEATPDGEFGRCVLSGVVIASVDIIDADNTHARVLPGSTQLRGDFGGWARIVYKPTGTGVKSCVLHVGETRTVRRKAKATTTINDNGSGSADVYIEDAARGNVTVHYNWMTGSGNIPSGSDLLIEYFHDEDKWIVVGAECPP